MKRNLAEEKVEPVLPLHAVWNKHKEIKLMDAEPAVKATRSSEFEHVRHAHNGKRMYSLLLTRIYILITWCFIF